MIEPLCQWIVAQRRWLLLLGLGLAVLSAYLGSGLHLDHKVVDLFPESDPVLAPYQELQAAFGRNDIVLAVFEEPELEQPPGQERIEQLTEKIRALDGVVGAVSLMDLPTAADFDNTGRGEKFREVFSGYTHNTAHNVAGVICLLGQEDANGSARKTTLQGLRALVAPLPSGTLVGETVILQEAFDLLEADGQRLNTWCTALLLAVVFACFRHWRWLLLTLIVVQMTLAFTRGLLVSLGLQLTMVSSMLAAIVTVVSVAVVIHVIVRYREGTALGLSSRAAMGRTLQILAWPVAFACLTDAVGFAALMVSQVGPIRDFGLMMAVGSLLVLVSAFLAVPGITLLGQAPDSHGGKPVSDRVQLWLGRLLGWATRCKRQLYAGGIAITAAAAIGCPLLEVETDFTKNFHRGNDLLKGYEFVEERFGGAGVWDILIPIAGEPDKKFLLKLLELERTLENEVDNVVSAISLADAIDAGTNGLEDIGLLAKTAVRSSVSLMRARMPVFVNAIYRPPNEQELGLVRIMLRSPERLPAEAKSTVISEVRQRTRESFPRAEVTGYYVLLTNLIDGLLRDQWITFSVAGLSIFVMMALAFGSPRLALVTMIPNALPVLWLFGSMGLLGVRMNMGAAMIAAVSLGLSVDGSIHYVINYLRERRAGASKSMALEKTHSTVGSAAVFATLALIIGFATLCISEFLPTVYFGVLVSLSMLGGLVGNLVVLPLLIQSVDRETQETEEQNKPIPEPHVNGQVATDNSGAEVGDRSPAGG